MPAPSTVTTLLQKLTPKLLGALLAFALILFTAVVLYTISQNGKINLAGVLVIDPNPPLPEQPVVPNNGADQQHAEKLAFLKTKLKRAQAVNQQLQQELDLRPDLASFAECRDKLDNSIARTALANALGLPRTTRDVLTPAQQAAIAARDLATLKNNFSYYLLRLELAIPQYGNSISTQIRAADRQPVYQLIQRTLQELDFYTGEINGEQRSTFRALAEFQKSYNKRAPASQHLKPLGTIGYRTLEALRSHYRARRS